VQLDAACCACVAQPMCGRFTGTNSRNYANTFLARTLLSVAVMNTRNALLSLENLTRALAVGFVALGLTACMADVDSDFDPEVDVELDEDAEDGESPEDADTEAYASWGGSMSTAKMSYTCSGGFCTCQGDVDCNEMFTDSCHNKPNDICFGSTCYCW